MYTDTVKGLPTQKTVCFAVGRTVREAFAPQQVIKMMELDFNEQDKDCLLSQDDKKFIQTMEHGIHRTDNGHYEMPLPLKEEPLNLPNNRSQALNRLSHLKKRFKANPSFYKDYKDFMENLIGQGYAERVDLDKDCGDVWYIPHHGIYHPKKPTKIRVVFDCSSKFQDHCLNDYLLQGPDLTNDMTGVLCRFRKEPIAVVCDIEQMFYQFNVNNEHRDLLRFLWWDDSDFNLNPVEYRMTVHLFGATSSPGCANYGLKRIADENKGQCGAHAARIVHRNFYVDDGVFSVATASRAITLITDLKEMCRLGGLRLHKFVSSDKSVLQSIPVEDRASELKDLDIMSDSLPLERALGVQWCVESDTFKFQITLKDQPLTRRGILSSVSSIFDPLGFLAPVMLVGKQILQEMVRDQTDWDTPLPDALRTRWEKWRQDLFKLETLSVERCIKPLRSGEHFQVELHHFSDASVQGYGQVSYIKMKDGEGTVHCSFLMGKARVALIRHVTIPRLELTAAVVSVKVGTFLQRELDYGEVKHVYWTDSQIVLGYINNDTRRFHVYVANRVEQIKSRTSSTQWKYVPSERNPADCASRGMSVKAFIDNSIWINGPEFLWKSDVIELEEDQNILALDPDDPEVKQVKAHVIQVSNAKSILEMERLEIFSDFYRLKRAIANCIRLKRKLKREISSVIPSPLSVEDLQKAEMVIIRTAQHSAFSREIDLLTSMQSGEQGRQRIVLKDSPLYKLDPFLDTDGLLRVGGRLRSGLLTDREKHQIILPRRNHVSDMIIRHFHGKIQHQGRCMTINCIRENGYWIIGCCSSVKYLISKCITCRRLRGTVQDQRMADLPRDRLEPEAPFTFCAVDVFGPWYIKEARKELKRYGVLFTCMSSRAIHIETANSMTTDSFISALRRLIALRGPIRQIRCDQGTNFMGAERELRESLDRLKADQIHSFLLKENCDVQFKMNVPSASHMGGVWERQIRTVRSILSALLKQHGHQIDDESLRTLMCEASAIVNSRPLTVDGISDLSREPLTPNHLLTMKSRIVLPPPGDFQHDDLYSIKRWRRVQYLANVFWKRWRTEYLQTLQIRQKWTKTKKNIKPGDIVIVKNDNLPRCMWQLARVDSVVPSDDGIVRKVRLACADSSSLDQKGKRLKDISYIDRPVHKTVMLLES